MLTPPARSKFQAMESTTFMLWSLLFTAGKAKRWGRLKNKESGSAISVRSDWRWSTYFVCRIRSHHGGPKQLIQPHLGFKLPRVVILVPKERSLKEIFQEIEPISQTRSIEPVSGESLRHECELHVEKILGKVIATGTATIFWM